MTTTRTRFAPSPTGYMHVGGVRTALFAWLVAKQAGGQFILRLEDTDKAREVAGSAEHLTTTLRALGLLYDEGPDIGGPYAPYTQSERLEHYRQWAELLIATGRAYADPYTPAEVQVFREEAQAAKQAFLYRNYRPTDPPVWDGSQPLRFKSDPKAYTWHDEVMGELSTGPEVVDDFILIKSDGYPTYNFAHIVDDAEMRISHVIRGQEFISSMPNYLNLYEALGYDMATVATNSQTTPAITAPNADEKPNALRLDLTGHALPTFATMPHIMNETGNKKLGKRDGAQDVLTYIRAGFLPEALVSFIATLGWNDGTTQEVFSRDELIEKFSLSRVGRSGARFDEKRLLWVNGHFIRQLSADELYEQVEPFWSPSAQIVEESYRRQVLALVQDRLKTLADLPSLTSYFFEEPTPDWSLVSANKQLARLEKSEITSLLTATHDRLNTIESWTSEAIQTALNELLEQTNQKPGILFSLIRIVTTWAPFSPQLNDTFALLGRERTLTRLLAVVTKSDNR